jgi:threonine/homoserine/homoserine lactone efflux protein
MTLAFFLMSAALLFTPGPTNTLLAVGGAARGLRRSLALPLAELAGYFAAIHLLAFLAGPLVQAAWAQMLLRLALALYLFWVAVQLWRSTGSLLPQRTVTPAQVLLVTLLNPKAIIFAFVVLPPLVDGWPTALPQLIALAVMILLASLSWITLGAMLAQGRIVRPQLIPRAGAVVLAGFALVLLSGVLR